MPIIDGQGGTSNTGQPPAGDSGAPPAGGTPSGGTQPPAGATTGTTDDELDQAMSLREARALRRENAEARKRLEGFEQAERTRAQQGMTELEREKAARAAAEQALATERASLRNDRLAIRIEAAATRLGFIDPEAAVKLLDRDAVEWDSTETSPTNLDKLLKALLTSKPYLRGQAPGSANAGEGNRGSAGGGAGDMNSLIRSGAGRRVVTND